MYAVRRFAVRQSRFFERFYQIFEHAIIALDPVGLAFVGHGG